MTCSGLDVFTGAPVEVRFDGVIHSVSPGDAAAGGGPHIAPGWIDIQVNGFAGVDYNSPSTAHEEIARSMHVMFSAGVTRVYPTVITGALDDMANALRNLSRAKDALREGAAMD